MEIIYWKFCKDIIIIYLKERFNKFKVYNSFNELAKSLAPAAPIELFLK